MSSPHTYEALSSPDHIRVIILEPSLDCSAPLQFSFHQASLGDLEAQYEAISYCWGPPVLECPLFNSDGTVVHVTKNLESAIRRFCLRAEQRWLWADAACINQNDDQEKAVQIPLMVGIFRGAKTVLAWLGEPDDDDDDDDAVRAIQGLIRLSRKQRQGGLQQAIQSSGEMPSVEVMLKALKLHWFSRLWIIQEVVHNIDVMFHYGKAMISWPRFCIALESWYADITVPDQTSRDVMEQKIRSIRRIYQLWVQHCGVIGPLHTTLHVASEDRSLGIIDLMTEFVEYGCSDDRDRIFAMYS
ncbi:HET-domain-containing protein, partial [Lophiostoma macrostomum CBS 122681]